MHVLSATDLLRKSEHAVDRAALLAEQLDGGLSLLHVVSDALPAPALELELQHSASDLRERARPPRWRHTVAPNILVRTGKAHSVIVDVADECRANLIVLGPHRRRYGMDALADSIAERVLSARKFPVLIVRNPVTATYRNVVLAVESSSVSVDAVRAAERFVLTENTRAILLYAYEPPYRRMLSHAGVGEEGIDAYVRGWNSATRQAMLDLLAKNDIDGSRYEIVLRHEPPVPAIRKAIEGMSAELLVMGTRGYGRWWRAVCGSVMNRVLHEVESDILVVPDGTYSDAPSVKRPPALMPEQVVRAGAMNSI